MSLSTSKWINKEFLNISFGDKRLNSRLKSMMVDISKRGDKNISSVFDSWSAIKASYRFLSNPKVTPEKIISPHRSCTIDRMNSAKKVLILQDSTFISLGGRNKTSGLDLLNVKHSTGTQIKGLLLHNTFAISTDGIPLGVLEQNYVTRNKFKAFQGERPSHNKKYYKDKESYRWIKSIKENASIANVESEFIHVADREADIYELYRDCLELNQKYIIRACNNRCINKEYKNAPTKHKLFDYLEKSKAQGIAKIKIQSNGKTKFREARLSIVYKEITVPAPSYRTIKRDGHHLPSCPMYAIMAIERKAPANTKPIRWTILTNFKINNIREAMEKITWYSYRWDIEIFHKILKSGFSIEKAQLRTAESLKNNIAMKSILAWRIFWLRRSLEKEREKSCETVLTTFEWQVLYKKFNKGKKLPNSPPTVGDVYHLIGRMGGFIGRKGDGNPGIKSIWLGWMEFMKLLENYDAFCG